MPTSKPAIGQAAGKAADVEAMFDEIAPRYDLLNRVLSFGTDVLWRKKAVRMLDAALSGAPRRLFDMATGTGDLALELLALDPDEVVGIDISEGMLAFGRTKVRKAGEDARVRMIQGSADDMPGEPASFDGGTVAFGVRNFEDLQAGLRGMARALKPGAPLVVLETSQPTAFPIKQGYRFYAQHVMPRVGGAISGTRAPYEYLPESAAQFPYGEAFLREMRAAGFTDCVARPLTFGVASLYRGLAP